MEWLNKLLGANKDLRDTAGTSSGPQAVHPQKKVITITDLPDFDASIKALIIFRLKHNNILDDEALETIQALPTIQCLGVPEATILNVIVLYTQLAVRISSFEALKLIDESRADGIRTKIHQNMELIEYLRIRVHQELYSDPSPPLFHPDWTCDETTFALLYSIALNFFQEFIDSPESNDFL